jgi:hypothetical protein
MESMYDDIVRFMREYFPAYSEQGQIAETQHVMDKFYAPDLAFDDGIVTKREQWYKICLSHPKVQDKITLQHIWVDDRQNEVGTIVKTQAIERASGKIVLELKMNVLYILKIDKNKDIKISNVKVFLESDPQKAAKLFQVYGMGK